MVEVKRVTVELFPIFLKNQRLHLLEQRCSRIRRQDFEVGAGRAKFARKPDGRLETLFRILQETENIKRGRTNPEFPAKRNHLSHVFVRNEATSHPLERCRLYRLHAKANLTQAGSMQGSDQLLVQIVHARFAFKRELESARANAGGDAKTAIAIEREKRIANDNVDAFMSAAQFSELVEHVLVRASAKTGGNPVRAVRAVLGTTAAGQHRHRSRETEATAVHVAEAFTFDQVPTWKRERVEIVYRCALHAAVELFAGCEFETSGFRLTANNKVARIRKQFRQVRRGCAQETDAQTVLTCELGPGSFVLVINDRAENERHIAFDLFALCVNNPMARARQNGREVTELNTRQVLKDGANVFGKASHHGVGAKARPVTTRDGVFVDKATMRLQIGEYKSLQLVLASFPEI